MPTVYIFAHGTSQDSSKFFENTVQLARELKKNNLVVYEVNGVGSELRSIELADKHSTTGGDSYPDQMEGLAFISQMLAGVLGVGMKDNIQEITELARKAMEDGACNIKLIGFSRGAVAVAHALEGIGKHISSSKKVVVEAALLDPVPGTPLPQKAVVPAWVDKLVLLQSLHEGRPGFSPLELEFQSQHTKKILDTYIGSHGEIGGSSRGNESKLPDLVKERIKLEMNLPLVRMSDEDYDRLVMDVACNADRIIMGHNSVPQQWNPRNTRQLGDITWPSFFDMMRIFRRDSNLFSILHNPSIATIQKVMQQNNFRTQAAITKISAAAERGGFITVVEPTRPVVDGPRKTVVMPPTVRRIAGVQNFNFLRRLLMRR